MQIASTLRRYGLFDAKVPRYTSYPPANRFAADLGARFQKTWLSQIAADESLSLYIHIPFCRRLCWFCACRTQGTKTLSPVATYVDVLLQEIDACRTALPAGVTMRRLHLGGGTPTLLDATLMRRLLDRIFGHFPTTDDMEFSVEIDPTEAAPEVLAVLAERGMTRASIGVQDFAPAVQQAIGRSQGFEQTRAVIDGLRANGVTSLNMDVLYGLPYQTESSMKETLAQILSLLPDRLALYGYAHVPHVSKRQVMIPDHALPDAEARYHLARLANIQLTGAGYAALGIDHFALAGDSLTKAARSGGMVRNFQGYTDDPCETLLGIGASAISKFRQGYVQNAVSTSAYAERVGASGFAGHKGISLTAEDRFISAVINDLMCNGSIRTASLSSAYPDFAGLLARLLADLQARFSDLVEVTDQGLHIHPDSLAATRLIAAAIDPSRIAAQAHSLAV